jgi:hypothetical protein
MLGPGHQAGHLSQLTAAPPLSEPPPKWSLSECRCDGIEEGRLQLGPRLRRLSNCHSSPDFSRGASIVAHGLAPLPIDRRLSLSPFLP